MILMLYESKAKDDWLIDLWDDFMTFLLASRLEWSKQEFFIALIISNQVDKRSDKLPGSDNRNIKQNATAEDAFLLSSSSSYLMINILLSCAAFTEPDMAKDIHENLRKILIWSIKIPSRTCNKMDNIAECHFFLWPRCGCETEKLLEFGKGSFDNDSINTQNQLDVDRKRTIKYANCRSKRRSFVDSFIHVTPSVRWQIHVTFLVCLMVNDGKMAKKNKKMTGAGCSVM
jgi:hypothetical protein